MLVGVNVTSSANWRFAQQAIARGDIEFVEILIDNFWHLDPKAVFQELNGVPVSIHIMASHFLDSRPEECAEMASRIRKWVDVLEPIYVSDHLGHWEVEGQRLAEMCEVDYENNDLFDRVLNWRRLLGCELLLENFPSLGRSGSEQLQFFEELRRLGVQVLFDISNAVIAEKNGAAHAEEWLRSRLVLDACHIGGFQESTEHAGVLIDSHDCSVSQEAWDVLRAMVSGEATPRSLIVERDANIVDDEWFEDIRIARNLSEAKSPCRP